MDTIVSHSVAVFVTFWHFLSLAIVATRASHRGARPAQGHRSCTGGCWGDAGRCVCASGAACAARGGRAARLLDLTANEDGTTRVGVAADPESEIADFLKI